MVIGENKQDKMNQVMLMYTSTSEHISESSDSWKRFLSLMAKLYTFDYADQLLIYRQKPTATACTSFDNWNDKMNRFVKKGAFGIALLKKDSYGTKLRYVFDVSDTGEKKDNPKTPKIWEVNSENDEIVSEKLNNICLTKGESINSCIGKIAITTAQEYYESNKGDISEEVLKEEKGLVYDSLLYTLNTRLCNDSNNNTIEGITSVKDIKSLTRVGTVISKRVQEIFKEVSLSINAHEKESKDYETTIQDDGRAISTTGGIRVTGSAVGEIWKNEGRVPTQPRRINIQPYSIDRTDATILVRSAEGVSREDRATNERNVREAESSKQDEATTGMGRVYEQSTLFSGGDSTERDSLSVVQNSVVEKTDSLSAEAQKLSVFPMKEEVTVANFKLSDYELGKGTKQEKFEKNIQAIKTLKAIESEESEVTLKDQEVLSNYIGWGGLADYFDSDHKQYEVLKDLLTDTEYEQARASTLNAHYTAPEIIKTMYQGLSNFGFRQGNILEPAMGVGNYFGMLPDDMKKSNLYGVELDSISGRIAKQLYPNANIEVTGFERADHPDNFFDVAIGNVPFGNYKLSEKRYDKNGFMIHDHFFAKSLDKVRAGGVVAFITSKGTMDKKNSSVRRYLAQRAELLGAIRLPNTAFKENAGTEVTSDIIFLQKRETPVDIECDWLHLGVDENGIEINSYFVDHPEMILGTMEMHTSQFGMDSVCVPHKDKELVQQLEEVITNIKGDMQQVKSNIITENDIITMPADPTVKNYSYTLIDDEIWYRENSIMYQPAINDTTKERIKGMVEIRTILQNVIQIQLDNEGDDQLESAQHKLNEIYDKYTKKHGLINSRSNAKAFAEDNSYYLLSALEDVDEEGNLKSKADMFTKRTINKSDVISNVDTPTEALAISISEKVGVDIAYMSKLCGKNETQIYDELKGVIFLNPLYEEGNDTDKYLMSDEYLSGNIRRRLEVAEQNPELYGVNIEALKIVMPKDLEASEIDVKLGATWVSASYIQDFMYDLLKTSTFIQESWSSRKSIKVAYNKFTSEWNISNKTLAGHSDVTSTVTYGTSRMNGYKILEETLNLKDVRIYDLVKDLDGKEKRVLNKKETTLAQQKQQEIKQQFNEWVFKDADRRNDLVNTYNQKFNSTRAREYDGSHINFVGMSPDITLRKHQRDAIAHILYGGNTLLAHEVGAGKSFEMIAGAMESKRLGLCTKPLLSVPNHLTEQMAGEFLRLYPSANILVATKKDFEKANRKRFCARIATGEYDAVIMGHSQFERIPMSYERQERLFKEQIDEVIKGIESVRIANGERSTIKQLERSKKSIETKLQKLQSSERKDDVVTFEQLGVDKLIVDEAHAYKNGFVYTKMRNVAGLGSGESQKANDMFMKCRYMDEITGGKGIVFATGTPISNSMTELYIMQKYLQYERLEEMGLLHFDAWASSFGETTTAIELAPEGTGYRAKTRFSKFFNLPELMTIFKEVADIKTSDQLSLPTPEIVYESVSVKPTDLQQGMVKELSKRASDIQQGNVDPSIDNMLKITSDGRKLGLDQRLIDASLPDDENSKVNACVNNVYDIWEENKEDKLTQLVFCDLSTPKGKKSNKGMDLIEKELLDEELGTFSSVYEDIKQKLIDKGVPEKEIAFIHDANTEIQKKDLFKKVRTGNVRVLLGSTSKCGAGMNVQDRLVALHDLDAPWRPGDLRQRSGRIERQGNMNKVAKIFRYVTEATFDSYLWQTLENKQKFISQIMTSKSPVRSCDDLDESALSYAEIKALCAGNPKIKQKMDLDIDVSKLKLLKASFMNNKYALEDKLIKYLPQKINVLELQIKATEIDIERLEGVDLSLESFQGMKIKDKFYTEKEVATDVLLNQIKSIKNMEENEIGEYLGFKLSVKFNMLDRSHTLYLKSNITHSIELSDSANGNLIRINNLLNKLPEKLELYQKELDESKRQELAIKEELNKEFPQEGELKEKLATLQELDKELNMAEELNEKINDNVFEKGSVLEKLKTEAPVQRGDTLSKLIQEKKEEIR